MKYTRNQLNKAGKTVVAAEDVLATAEALTLIDEWRAKGHCQEFLNYDLLETYKDFGGIRIEDDVLITSDGCRFLGQKRIPYHPAELEAFMATNS